MNLAWARPQQCPRNGVELYSSWRGDKGSYIAQRAQKTWLSKFANLTVLVPYLSPCSLLVHTEGFLLHVPPALHLRAFSGMLGQRWVGRSSYPWKNPEQTMVLFDRFIPPLPHHCPQGGTALCHVLHHLDWSSVAHSGALIYPISFICWLLFPASFTHSPSGTSWGHLPNKLCALKFSFRGMFLGIPTYNKSVNTR